MYGIYVQPALRCLGACRPWHASEGRCGGRVGGSGNREAEHYCSLPFGRRRQGWVNCILLRIRWYMEYRRVWGGVGGVAPPLPAARSCPQVLLRIRLLSTLCADCSTRY